jgi:hypothetical protein
MKALILSSEVRRGARATATNIDGGRDAMGAARERGAIEPGTSK